MSRHALPSPGAALDVDALVARLAPLVVERVAHLLVERLAAPKVVEFYDNTRPPPGWSRRRWREHASTIAGSYRDGREWRISRPDFDSFIRSTTTATAVRVAPANDDTWTPEAALAAVGYRGRRVIDPSAPGVSPEESRKPSEVSATGRATTSRSGGRP